MVSVYAMKNILYTLLLSIIFLAPQGELLADSDNQHNKIKPEKYKKVKQKHDKFWRVPFATKADLELISQDIAGINASLDALELQVGDLPADLADQLAKLQSATETNSGEISMALNTINGIVEAVETINRQSKINSGELDALGAAVDDLNKKLTALISRVYDHELRLFALEQAIPPEVQEIIFSGEFIGDEAPSDKIKADWNLFRSNAGAGSFQSIEIRNSFDGSIGGSIVCDVPGVAGDIATALSTFVSGDPRAFQCGAVTWNVGTCVGGPELNAGGSESVCNCNSEFAVRPFVGNEDWGGIIGFGGTTTCGAQSQTLEVILTR